MFLLDTNIVSDLVKNPAGQTAARLVVHRGDSVVTSLIVAGELRFGYRKNGSASLARRVEAALRKIEILPMALGVSDTYAIIRADLQRRGLPIGWNDTWIAAHAHHLGATLVTDNEREFRRVDGLAVENWLAP